VQLPLYTNTSRWLYGVFMIVDTIFPALAAIFMSLLWAWMLMAKENAVLSLIARSGILFLPFIASLLDWMENVGFMSTVLLYPERILWITDVAVWLREAKLSVMDFNTAVTGVIALLSLLLFVLTWKRST
jgi:hypothetical protein